MAYTVPVLIPFRSGLSSDRYGIGKGTDAYGLNPLQIGSQFGQRWRVKPPRRKSLNPLQIGSQFGPCESALPDGHKAS